LAGSITALKKKNSFGVNSQINSPKGRLSQNTEGEKKRERVKRPLPREISEDYDPGGGVRFRAAAIDKNSASHSCKTDIWGEKQQSHLSSGFFIPKKKGSYQGEKKKNEPRVVCLGKARFSSGSADEMKKKKGTDKRGGGIYQEQSRTWWENVNMIARGWTSRA